MRRAELRSTGVDNVTLEPALASTLRSALCDVLMEAYPEAKSLLGR